MMNGLPPIVEQLVDLALCEDLGNGDITGRLTVPSGHASTGRVMAREPLVVSGLDVFEMVMRRVDPDTVVRVMTGDGESAGQGDTILEASGRTASLLMAERVALNFLQRLSGVATMTRLFVERIPKDSGVRIVDTRKTTPGMRFLERRAVIHGGGRNHRPDLGGGILIKENHIRAAGSVAAAVARCLAGAPHTMKVEVEVTDAAELKEALGAGAEAVLLDNMSPGDIRRCVEIAKGRALIEVSGGVTLKNIESLAQAGVDLISIGALTHSYPSADMSFLLSEAGAQARVDN